MAGIVDAKREEIYAGARTTVYRSWSSSLGCSVILKTFSTEYPTVAQRDRLRREFALGESLECDGVIRHLALDESGSRLVLVEEDIGGQSLRRLFAGTPLELQAFLPIATKLARALVGLHGQGVIHKDINPSNIVLNVKTGELRLIDLGLSTRIRSERILIQPVQVLEGTLPYLSPEQTGRMNRPVDLRTDLYSLGMTFFDLLAGRPAFEGDTAGELIHSHLARPLPRMSSLGISVPGDLVALIERLTAKEPLERYQTAFGVLRDLEMIAGKSYVHGKFSPGIHDRSSVLLSPGKIYGRASEVNQLLQSFDRAAAGSCEVLLVGGSSGSGKSALIAEVHKPVSARRGLYAEGKYDQYRQDVPYVGFTAAIQQLLLGIEVASAHEREVWKARLQEAVGSHGQVLTDLFPDLGNLLDLDEPAPALSLDDLQNRLMEVFRRFLAVFCRPGRPLVLFLDDLQWAGSSTATLLRSLLLTGELHHLLLIGAYRSNEMGEDHPISVLGQQLDQVHPRVHRIQLKGLPVEDVVNLLSDTLAASHEQCGALGGLIHSRTGGNPLAVDTFIRHLVAREALSFDHGAGRWGWDVEQIQALDIPDRIVDILTYALQGLSEETRQVLSLGAALGSTFSLNEVVAASERTASQGAAALWPAQQDGLLLAMGHGRTGAEAESSPRYRFAHDRVQEAAYQLLPQDQRAGVHLQMARRLAELGPVTDEQVFNIVHHFNRGLGEVKTSDDRFAIARQNLDASRRAKAASSFDNARVYAKKAMELLGSDTDVDIYGDVLLELAESEFLSSNNSRALALLDGYIHRVPAPRRLASALELQIQIYANQGEFTRALEAGARALRPYGIVFKPGQTRVDMVWVFLRVKLLLLGKSDAELLGLPEVDDEGALTALRLLSVMTSPAYAAGPQAVLLVALRTLQICIRYGNSPASAFAYSLLGVAEAASLGTTGNAKRFSELAIALNHHYDDTLFRARVYFMKGCFTQHWYLPARAGVALCRRGHEAGLASGDFNYAMYNGMAVVSKRLFAGESLVETYVDAVRYTTLLTEVREQLMKPLMTVMRNFIVVMIGADRFDAAFGGQARSELDEGQLRRSFGADAQIDDARFFEDQEVLGSGMGASFLWTFRAMLAWFDGAYEDALACSLNGQKIIESGAMGQVVLYEHYLYQGLILCSVGRTRPLTITERLRLTLCRVRVGRWARTQSDNFASRGMLLRAEYLRYRRDPVGASDAYRRTVQLAQEAKLRHIEAIANERHAQLCAEGGDRFLGRVFAREAHYLYGVWGALSRVDSLERTWGPDLRAVKPPAHSSVTTTTTSRSSGADFDYVSSVRAFEALADEVDQKDMLSMLLSVSCEQAGASRATLFLRRSDGVGLTLAADRHVGESSATVDGAGEMLEFPEQLLNQASDSLDPLVFHDLASVDQPELQALHRRGVKSVLLMPLRRTAGGLGVLYFEHLLLAGAFNERVVRSVGLLATQAVVAIENGQLNESLRSLFDDLQLAEVRLRETAVEIEDTNAMLSGVASALTDLVSAEPSVEILHKLLRSALARTGSGHGFVAALTEEGTFDILVHEGRWAQTPFYQAVTDTINWKGHSRLPLRQGGWIRHSIVSGQPISGRGHDTLRWPEGHPETEGHLVVPLVDQREEVLGLIVLFDSTLPQLESLSQLDALLQAMSVVFDSERAKERADALQWQLNQSQKMEAVGQLASGIAHDFNNILSVQMGFIQFVLDQLDADTEVYQDALEVQRSTQRAARLTQQLLTFGRRDPASTTVFDPNQVLESVSAMISPLIGESIRVEWKLSSGVWHTRGDEGEFEQVVVNLVLNARDAMPNGGTLAVTTENLEDAPDNMDCEGCMRLSVRDDGEGMTHEVQERIFEPFYTTKEQGKGTGLGLSTSYEIVKRFGGMIEVKSRPGVGTTFSVYLPRADVEALEDLDATLIDTTPSRPGLILLVEDEDPLRAIASRALQAGGHTVLVASNGMEALALFERNPKIDLMVTDLVMPQMGGMVLIDRLREQRPSLPILVTSGNLDHPVSDSAQDRVMYVQKPYDPQVLVSLVHQLLQASMEP